MEECVNEWRSKLVTHTHTEYEKERENVKIQVSRKKMGSGQHKSGVN